MMAQFGFDTLAFVKRLTAAGMDSRQAEALSDALSGNAFNEVVTKDYLHLELTQLRGEFRADIKDLELRMMNRIGTMIAASAGLTVAILGTLIALT